MDAVEFLKAAERRSLSDPTYYGEFIKLCNNDWVALVAQVERWSKDHPIKTRQSEFLEIFPNALKDEKGILHLVPCALDINYKPSFCTNVCSECREDYWLQEVE